MKKMAVLGVVAPLLFVVACTCCASARAQSLESTLEHKVASFDLEDSPVRRCLEELTARYDFTVGFESIPEPPQTQPQKINLRVEKGTVRDVLNELVSQDTRYKWIVSAQAINVLPVVAGEPWMDAVIEHFKVDQANRDEAVDALLASPEIKSASSHRVPKRRELRSLPGVATSDLTRFSLELRHATVRSILNAIAKSDHTSVWIYLRYGKDGEYSSIKFTNLVTIIHRPG